MGSMKWFTFALLGLSLGNTARSAESDTFPIDLVMNSGFEWVADSTTTPKKYGAYWENAFVPKEGIADDRIVEDGAGGRLLELVPDSPEASESVEVGQILTLLGPHSDRLVVQFRFRLDGTATRLLVRQRFQAERVIEIELGAETAPTSGVTIGTADANGFRLATLEIGRMHVDRFGAAPTTWSHLGLRSHGGKVHVDDVVAVLPLPRITHRDLKSMLLDDVRDVIATFVEGKDGPSGKGLGLVDPVSGYQTGGEFDVVSGAMKYRERQVGIRGIHEVMLRYARAVPDRDEDRAMQATVRDLLNKHARSVLQNNVYAKTGLFCLYDLVTKSPWFEAELSPSHFIEYVLDVAELLPEDKQLTSYALFHAERMADTMVSLRKAHDLPKNIPFGRGDGGNWFGRMPEKVSPFGVLAPPKKSTYDQAWAIQNNRSWYHDFDTAAGLMRMHRVKPKASYVEAVNIACQKFDRVFDAQRYDMENDTDDHYGRNVETALMAYRFSNGTVPCLLEFAQKATDHRLPRELPFDESLWVQGIRLGSFTTGDQPRAFRGPIGLYTLSKEQNPLSAGLESYRQAIREIVKADLRRRMLDDGLYTEASSWQWRMISACFQGSYIAPCSEREKWEGDMGDLFAGPPANAFRALLRVLEIDPRGPDREWVALYATLFTDVVAKYREKYGYRFGMDPETGKRYGIPTKYLTGFSTSNPYGLAIALLHAEVVETGCLDTEPPTVELRSVVPALDDGKSVSVELSGPPGSSVRVRGSENLRYDDASDNDWRIRHVSRQDTSAREVLATLDAAGRAKVELKFENALTGIAVDAELLRADGRGIDDLRGGFYSLAAR